MQTGQSGGEKGFPPHVDRDWANIHQTWRQPQILDLPYSEDANSSQGEDLKSHRGRGGQTDKQTRLQLHSLPW